MGTVKSAGAEYRIKIVDGLFIPQYRTGWFWHSFYDDVAWTSRHRIAYMTRAQAIDHIANDAAFRAAYDARMATHGNRIERIDPNKIDRVAA